MEPRRLVAPVTRVTRVTGVVRAALALLALAAPACGEAPSEGSPKDAGGAPEAATGDGGASLGPLGMNDVTVLVPLPSAIATPVLLRGADQAADGTPFLPRALFDRLVEAPSTMPIATGEDYDKLQLVAVRIDLCDRTQPGVCPTDVDGRLRLVFQPLTDDRGAQDVGFHAFYAIPVAALAAVIRQVRELATIQGEPPTSPLRVSPGLSGVRAAEHATKLRELVRKYGGERTLQRLTLNAQPIFSSIRWAMRGVERRGGTFESMTIGGGAPETKQDITLFSAASYTATPATDTPAGLFAAFSQPAFESSPFAEQRRSLEILAAVDNPLVHGPDTVTCIGCHASTVAMSARAKTAAVDPATVSGRYVSTFDTSIAGGKSASTERTVRALGWLGREPMISQRVANDTAQVLREIEERFPR